MANVIDELATGARVYKELERTKGNGIVGETALAFRHLAGEPNAKIPVLH
jgi:hypothetical protein